MENDQFNLELNDQQLDKLSRHVVRASQAADEVVEAAAASPFLYQRLRARMEAENIVPYQKRGWRAYLSPFLGALSGLRWTMAATAAVLLLVGVVAVRISHRTSPVEVASNQQPVSAGSRSNAVTSAVPAENLERGTGDGTEESKPVVPVVKASLTRRAPAIRAAVAEEEVVSDFMPLTYSGNSGDEGGQIVRVEMPRAALLALGLPVNAEITGEKLKADVLLGGDGVALAIRFVQ